MKAVILIARCLFAAFFLVSIPGHLGKQAVQMAADHNVPVPELFVPLGGIIALFGGLSILTGYKTKIGAFMLAALIASVTLYLHNFWDVADPSMAQVQQLMFMKNVATLGGALAFAFFGAGPLSVDAYAERISRRATKDITTRAGTPALKPSH